MIVYNLSPEFEYNITIFLYTLDLVKIFLIETYIKEFEASTQEYKKKLWLYFVFKLCIKSFLSTP